MKGDLGDAATIASWLNAAGEGAVAGDDSTPMGTICPQKPRDSQVRALLKASAMRKSATGSETLELGDCIGRGGMAEVLAGKQHALAREVAVKRLHSGTDEAARAGLLHEAWLTGFLEHPNIVPIHDLIWTDDGLPVVVMRRIEGTTWSTLLRDPERVRQLFGVSDVVEWHMRIFMQVCNAIHYAHSRGVIHRDIKPENVMVGHYGEVYVVDWGIAFAKRGPLYEALAEVAPAACAGTACYLAPEMLEGRLDLLDVHTDVYLLGATLYHCIVGRPPHDARTVYEALLHAGRRDVEFPDTLTPDLREVLHRALAKDPKERFSSAEELRKAVQLVLEHRDSVQLVASASQRLAQLRQAIAAADFADRNAWREVYKIFSSCRYRYRSALELWSENQLALGQLTEATALVIRAELAHGNHEAAETLLAELEDAPEELRNEVEDALVEARERDAALLAAARKVGQLSPFAGHSERAVILMALGLFFLLRTFFFLPEGNWGHLVGNIVAIGVVLIGVAVKHKVLLSTTFNVRGLILILTALSVNILIRSLGLALDHPKEILASHEAVLHFTLIVCATVTLDRRFLVPTIVYGATMVLSFLTPDVYHVASGMAHAFFGFYLGVIWWREPDPNVVDRDVRGAPARAAR